jgi:hypothetical protein
MALLEVSILDINDPNNIGNTPKHLIGTKLDSGAKIADFTPSRSPGLPPDVSHYILKLSDEVGLSDTALKHKYDEVVQSSWREELGLTPKETWRKVQEELSERA